MIFARRALTPQGWISSARIAVAGGRIASVEPDARPRPGDALVDTLLPAPGNLHSHSFQRAMAGMTERRAKGRDSFWTWREVMYRFLDRLTPEQVEAIAAFAFMEMLEAGFAAVGEFHYLHNPPGGGAYDDPAELSRRIAAAAAETGIGLTLLPVLYTRGGVDGRALEGGQRRFGATLDHYLAILERAAEAVSGLGPDARLGVAPHSLRAVAPDEIAAALQARPGGPIHIHAAEQTAEVEQVEAALGARPVRWLLENAGLDRRWCVIHATHMSREEVRGLARSGAVAGLCPLTEASLGDGVFELPGWLAAGGAFGVGTDSNIRISLRGELEMLEYSQRLTRRARNVAAPEGGSTGEALFLSAARGAAQALDRDAGEIAPGRLADLLAIDAAHPALCALRPEQILDGFVFTAADGAVTDVWSAGRRQVAGGRHVARGPIADRYRQTMRALAEG